MNTQHSGSTGEEKGRLKDPQIYVDHFIDHVSQQLNLEQLIALIEPIDFPLIIGMPESFLFE